MLADLPDDALIEVLSRVDGDLHPIACTCRRLRDVCARPSARIAWFVAGVHAAAAAAAAAAATAAHHDHHPLALPLRAVPPLLAALKWRGTRPFRSDPQRLAEFCCDLIDSLTPLGGPRDVAARRGATRGGGGGGGGADAANPRPLRSPRGTRGPPPPARVALMGCEPPHARPYLRAALSHCRSGRPLHALVALASALPPVLQPLLLPFLVAGGHAEAALRLLDAEGCLDQPGCLGGRFDLDLGGGAGPGALLPADAPLLPRLRAAARAHRLGLRPGEEEWWWWWLPARNKQEEQEKEEPAADQEARLLRQLEHSGLRCLRWALWEPVRLGDRPPRGLGPCAGGGARRAVVAPLAMSLAAAVRLLAAEGGAGEADGGSGKRSGSGGGGGGEKTTAAAAPALSRLVWALTEATMFARLFRHHIPGPWYRRSPLLLPGCRLRPPARRRAPPPRRPPPLDEEEEEGEDEEGQERFYSAGGEDGDPNGASDEEEEGDDDDEEEEQDEHSTTDEEADPPDQDEGGAEPGDVPRHPAFGQRRAHEPEWRRRGRWRWRGRAVWAAARGGLAGDGVVAAGRGGGAAAAAAAAEAAVAAAGAPGLPSSSSPCQLAPWCTAVARLSAASPQSPAARAALLRHVPLLHPRARTATFSVRSMSADPVGALFGDPSDPLALPALVEMAACAGGGGGARRLRDAWCAGGGEARGQALFERSCWRSAHLLAALALGGAAAGVRGDSDDDDPETALFRQALAGGGGRGSGNSNNSTSSGIRRRLESFPPLSASLKPALCAAGEAGNAGAMRLLLASPQLTFPVLSAALRRACGGAVFRLPHPPPRAEAWHPAGATLSPALSPPSAREWPEETLALLLEALTGPRFREEAAEALVPGAQLCLLRRPADRERTLRAVWRALAAVPVAAEQLASRTGQRLAPTSGRGSGAVEGRGEPASVLALLAARGDEARVRWVLRAAPTAAFKAREYPVLLALERARDPVARLILDAPRVADGFGPGTRQASARGRVYAAARGGDARGVRDALADVGIAAERNAWWSPLLAEMIANAAEAEVAAEARAKEGGGNGGGGRFLRVLRALVEAAEGKLGPEDAYAASVGLALGRGWGCCRWGAASSSSSSGRGEGVGGDGSDTVGADGESDPPPLPAGLARFLPRALRRLLDPCTAPGGDPSFNPLRLALAAALLADGSRRALDSLARLEDDEEEDEDEGQERQQQRQQRRAPGRPSTAPPPTPLLHGGARRRAAATPTPSLGADVGLLLARHCQLKWPCMAIAPGQRIAGGQLEFAEHAACAGAPGGWCVPSERPFPARAVLLAACRPGAGVDRALREAARAAAAGRRSGGAGRGGGGNNKQGDDEDDDDDEHDDEAEEDEMEGGDDADKDDDFWEPDEDADEEDDDELAPPRFPAGLRSRLRALLGDAGVLVPPPPPRPAPGPRRRTRPPGPLPPPDRAPRLRATAVLSRPHPYRQLWEGRVGPASSAAVQARGDALALCCAALLARRGARAHVEAEAVWRCFGAAGGDGGPAGEDDAEGPLLRPPPGAPPLAPVADVRGHALAFASRGDELAAELDELPVG